jgi:hypothetical protein
MEQTPTRPKFEWRLLILLCALSIPASLAIIPYSLALSAGSLENLTPQSGVSPQTLFWINVVIISLVSLAQTVFINWPFTALGMLAAKPLGLGAPVFSALLYKQPLPAGWKKGLLVGILTGIVSGFLLLLLGEYVFGPLMEADLAASGVNLDIQFTALDGLLASFGAAFNEEIMLRLFLLSALAWVGVKLFRQTSGLGFVAILWAANLGSTLVFGLIHISNLVILDMPLTLAVVGSTIAMNGMIGLLFGWLYWKHGLESAILSHFFVDIVLKVVTVLFLPQFL